jgi:hypothetical protein
MKKLTAIVLVLAMTASGAPAFALDGNAVTYVSGTMHEAKVGAAGTFDNSSPTALVIRSGQTQFSIPYSRITSFRYHEEAKIHLGLLPALSVVLVTRRMKWHYLTITWRGDGDVAEVATLEAPKSTANGLLEVLRARASQACRIENNGKAYSKCGIEQGSDGDQW